MMAAACASASSSQTTSENVFGSLPIGYDTERFFRPYLQTEEVKAYAHFVLPPSGIIFNLTDRIEKIALGCLYRLTEMTNRTICQDVFRSYSEELEKRFKETDAKIKTIATLSIVYYENVRFPFHEQERHCFIPAILNRLAAIKELEINFRALSKTFSPGDVFISEAFYKNAERRLLLKPVVKESCLGSGTFGVVFSLKRAFADPDEMAIKLFAKGGTTLFELQVGFLLAENGRHMILPEYYVRDSEGNEGLLMRKADGEMHPAERLEDGRSKPCLKPHDFLLCLSGWLKALRDLEKCRVSHGDVRLPNLLIARSKEGAIEGKLADFGVAAGDRLPYVPVFTPFDLLYKESMRRIAAAIEGPDDECLIEMVHSIDIWQLGNAIFRYMSGYMLVDALGQTLRRRPFFVELPTSHGFTYMERIVHIWNENKRDIQILIYRLVDVFTDNKPESKTIAMIAKECLIIDSRIRLTAAEIIRKFRL